MPLGTSTPVIGNGITLGITDGTNLTGLYYSGQTPAQMTGRTGVYGANVGTGDTGISPYSAVSLGITTDPTKSGLIADLTNATAASWAIIKY